ncbi:hypothetical protein Cph01nite_20010 [Cellulomonas phragmiteti]|uniref:Uncharacterized protein n=1 Tax=Cellulomonas phragmiteti TaxID=478780 RepID=A0ABQ4DLM1_9CELL|nr:hypothetical protein Cph01nite_20010 [Cellulomonas phragmiteti]
MRSRTQTWAVTGASARVTSLGLTADMLARAARSRAGPGGRARVVGSAMVDLRYSAFTHGAFHRNEPGVEHL